MNKLVISIIALAALSSAAYASYEKRDWVTCMDAYCDTSFDSSTMTKVSPLAVENNARILTPFERSQKFSGENDREHDKSGN